MFSECIKKIEKATDGKRVHVDLLNAIPKATRSVLVRCLEADPKARPTLRNVFQAVSNAFPQNDIMTTMIKRLEQYSEDLEILVYNRTQELLVEARNVDLILQQIIPPCVLNS